MYRFKLYVGDKKCASGSGNVYYPVMLEAVREIEKCNKKDGKIKLIFEEY